MRIPSIYEPPPAGMVRTGRRWVLTADTSRHHTKREGGDMAERTGDRGVFGIGLGGVVVIAGIVVAVFWSLWLGILIALVGLVAFGGFVRGKWY
jgi:hypothetical protein